MQTWTGAASPFGRAAINEATRYQEEIVMLIHGLSGHPRIESVVAALAASGQSPLSLYQRASRGEPLPTSFLEALYGPQKAVGR